jgi:hypothetical protein
VIYFLYLFEDINIDIIFYEPIKFRLFDSLENNIFILFEMKGAVSVVLDFLLQIARQTISGASFVIASESLDIITILKKCNS